MGYSVGETFMVEFVILNSSSLPFKDKYEFEKNIIEFLKVINYLSQKLKNYIKIKTFIEIKDMIIYSNKTLKETIYSIKDEVLRRKLFSLISNKVIKIENPILNKTNENKTYGLKEYKYEDKENKEFGYVDIFGTVLVSFLSNEKWNKIEIELLKISFLENEEIKEEKIKILNISLEKHFEEIKIKEFLKDRKYAGNIIANIKDRKIEIINELIKNYENKKDFLKKVHINKVVEETFTKIKNTRMFEEFVTIVCNLEMGAKEIKDYEVSDESDSVKGKFKLKEKRRFKFDDGSYRYIFRHMKNFSNGYRMYFEEKKDKIIICYFGKHLSTKKHKN